MFQTGNKRPARWPARLKRVCGLLDHSQNYPKVASKKVTAEQSDMLH